MNLVDLNIPSGNNSPLVMQYAGRIQLLRPVPALLSRTAVACRVTIEQRTDATGGHTDGEQHHIG